MKFCPNCGSVREKKDICYCGYNYLTGEVEKKEDDSKNQNNPEIKGIMGNYLQNGFYPHHGLEVSLEELKGRKLDLGDLLSVSFCVSGGMMGSYNNIELSFTKNQFIIVNQDWHHGPRIKKIYRVEEENAKEIKKILIDNNFRAWSEVPVDNSLFAYDAPSCTMTLTFEKKSVTFSVRIYMTEEEMKIYNELREKINLLIKEENKEQEEVIQEGISMMDTMTSITPSMQNHTKFCKECGRQLEEGIIECECGYKVEESGKES